jgi:heat shock protein HslJ
MMIQKIAMWILVCLLLAGCAGSPTAGNALDLSGEWGLTSLNGKQPIEGSTVTITFEDGQAGGRACNSYGGEYTLEGSAIQFGSLVQTEMACMEPEGVMEQETEYMHTLSQAASLNQTGDTLEVLNAAGDVVLVFSR